MSVDISLLVKSEIINALLTNIEVSRLVSDRVYGMGAPAKPTWPFIRYGSPIIQGYEASCWDGTNVRVTLHVFAESTENTAGEDMVQHIATAVSQAVTSFSPNHIKFIRRQWLQTQILSDEPEADRYHAVVEFSVTAIQA